MTNSTLPLLLLLMLLDTGVAASTEDELWIPEGSNIPILKNQPGARTTVCTYRSAEGLCYELWLDDRSDPNAHLPIPWSRQEDFVTILDKLDELASDGKGGYCLLHEGPAWSDWQGQGEANSACGELQHNTEQSTCLAPANACRSPCQPNAQRSRTGTVRNAACCVVTRWTPNPATKPVGETFTQTNNCGATRPARGTKPSACVVTSWSPDPATVPEGTRFTQSNGCTTKSAIGTKEPPCNADDWRPWETSFRSRIRGYLQRNSCGDTRFVRGQGCVTTECEFEFGDASDYAPSGSECRLGFQATIVPAGTPVAGGVGYTTQDKILCDNGK